MAELADKRKFYIDGAWVDPAAARDLEVIDPTTEEPVAVISIGGQADTDRAVAAAYCAPATYNAARCRFSGGVNSIDEDVTH